MIRLIRLLLLGLLTGCQSCTDDPATSSASQDDSGALNVTPPNILIIDLAGLRSDRLDNPPPGIKTLQNQGVTFSHSIAPSSESATSFTAMASGRTLPGAKPETEASTWTLFKALGAAGYHTGVAWGNTGFNKPALQDAWLAPSSTPQELGDIDGVTEVLKSDIQEPFLILLHDMDLYRSVAASKAQDTRTAHRVYNQTLVSYDAKIQVLLDTLNDTTFDQRTIVVLTANHGVDLYDHSQPGHDSMLWDTVLRTPLIIADPSLPESSHGYIQSRPVSTLDLAPTLLERAGLNIPVEMEGISLTNALHTHPLPERDFFSWTPNSAASIRNTKWKLILQPEGCTKREKESHSPLDGRQCTLLYDLDRDPDERENLTIGLPHVADQLEAQLLTWLSRHAQESTSTPADPASTTP